MNDIVELKSVCETILSENADKVLLYKNGERGVLGYFMGLAMIKTERKANPDEVVKIFKELLK